MREGSFEIQPVARDEAGAYADMTFPAYRHLVEAPPERDMAWFAATSPAGEPLGFAFGMGGPDSYEMCSVYVSSLFRRRGIGTALADALDTAFRERGYPAAAHFFTVDSEEQGYARFLIACGYPKPIVRQLVCKTTTELAYETPWLIRAKPPAGYKIGRWVDLPQGTREKLRGRKRADPGLYHDLLDPFVHERDCHHETSIVLTRDGEIRGWIITHVHDANTLRWTSSFVMEELQGAGRIIPLWWEVVQRQHMHTEMRRFMWTVPVETPRMMRFAQRRMRPWLESLGYACTALKPLGA